MSTEDNLKSLTSFLNCLSLLEKETFLLYRSVAKKVKTPLIRALFMEIAIDSQKHAVIIAGLSESLAKSEMNPKHCEKQVGEAWPMVKRIRREVAAMGDFSEEDLPQLMDKLDVFETILGEEYNIFVQMKTLEFITKEFEQSYDLNLTHLKSIFVSIIGDEKHHLKLLKTIRELFTLQQAL